MNKQVFLSKLRDGLRGVPRAAGEEMMADYEAHFAEAAAAGRSEAEAAAALGDPSRLARELRADAGIRQWEEKKTASSAATAVFALLGLGAIDFLILLPVLFGVAVVMFVLFIINIACFFGGIASFIAGLLGVTFGGGMDRLTAVLSGIGLMAGSVGWSALLVLACIGLVNALVWYGRLHMRVITPDAN